MTSPYTAIPSGVTAVVAGGNHTCALVSGAMQCFGWNSHGQLGDGSTGTATPTPYTVFASGVTEMAAGSQHTCAVVSGALKCWGWNDYGQVGTGTSGSDVSTPYTVVASGVTQVGAGSATTCYVSDALYCMGWNDSGQIGNGTSGATNVLTAVIPDFPNVPGESLPYVGSAVFSPLSMSLNSSTCVIGVGGTLQCFGNNTWGQIGTGTAGGNVLTPFTVFSSGVTAVATGTSHTCAVVSGSLQCFGANGNGQIGTGTFGADVLTPFTVFSSGVTAVAAGGTHTCAIVSGSLKCFGQGSVGQIGNGLTNARVLVPYTVFSSGVTAVAATGNHTCAVVSGALKCFGSNGSGQIGNGATGGNVLTPYTVIASGIVGTSVGQFHSCAVGGDGSLYCFGWNSSGQIGNGLADSAYVTTPYAVFTSGISAVSAGNAHTCAIGTNGSLQCFGSYVLGGRADPGVPRTEFPSGVTAVGTGSYSTCAIVSGSLQCFGNNTGGELGLGYTGSGSTIVLSPYDVFSTGVTEVALGASHTCAIVSGALKCIGENSYGQSGGATGENYVSTPATVFSSGVTAVAAGQYHTCAIVSGALKCFGNNDYGQIGNGASGTNVITPYTVFASGITAVYASANTTCAQLDDGTVWCFGDKGQGLFNDGDNSYSTSVSPMQIALPTGTIVDFSLGSSQACAIVSDSGTRKLYCWGGNWVGEIVDDSIYGDGLVNELLVTSATLEKVVLGGVVNNWDGGRTCFIDGGAFKCRGQNDYGQTDTSQVGTYIYTNHALVSSGVTEASARGAFYTCALVGNDVKCWGTNNSGVLGASVGAGSTGSAITILTSVGE